MESSQFINQTRLSKKQLQFHVQQQQNQKYFLDSPANDNYQQSRCQYFNSVTTPPSAHYPSDFPPNNLSNGHHQTLPHHQANSHCGFEQASPSHRHNNIKKFHQSDPNSIEVCIDYENQHNSQRVGVDPSSVSDVLETISLSAIPFASSRARVSYFSAAIRSSEEGRRCE